jgi:hypothetical protein
MVDSRSASIDKCHFAALLPLMVLLAAGVPALAADSIEELLQQDETNSHYDAPRRDLNALTEEQWQYYFKVERKQPDIELGGQLIVRESRSLYLGRGYGCGLCHGDWRNPGFALLVMPAVV